MNKSWYLLLSFISFARSMERNSIAPMHQLAIINAATVDEAADNFNRLVAEGTIAPTVANTRWCVYSLWDKTEKRAHSLILAQKLNATLACAWLNEYLNTTAGFLAGVANLNEAIAQNDVPRTTFLLSTCNYALANSVRFCEAPAQLMDHLKSHPQILACLLQSGLTRDVLPTGWGYLHAAAFSGYSPLVSILLAHGTEVDLPSQENISSGDTPLITLTKTQINIKPSHLETARILLHYGASTKTLSRREQKKPSELADLHNEGGLRAQLKELIQSHERLHKIA